MLKAFQLLIISIFFFPPFDAMSFQYFPVALFSLGDFHIFLSAPSLHKQHGGEIEVLLGSSREEFKREKPTSGKSF